MVSVAPISKKTYKYKQSPSEFLPALSARIIISGPSSSGKGVLCANLLLNPKLYRGKFDKIYYASGSSKLDHNLKPIKKYCEQQLGMEEGECMLDGWDEPRIKEIMRQAKEDTLKAKKEGKQYLPATCIICDDLADDKSAVKGNTLLNSIFLRGRHMGLSCILMTQRYRLVDVSTRVNANALFVFRMRNHKDLEAVIEENSALLNRKQLLEVYEHCTVDKFSFLYINLNESNPQNAFYRCFDAKLSIAEPDPKSNGTGTTSNSSDMSGVPGEGEGRQHAKGDQAPKGGRA